MTEIVWTLADVIVKLRKAKHWGRKRLAKEAGVAYMTITRLETGREMKEASIRRVAAAFGLRLAALYDLVPPAGDTLSRERDRIWNAMEPDRRKVIVDVMRQYETAPTEADHAPAPSPHAATGGKASGSGRGKTPA